MATSSSHRNLIAIVLLGIITSTTAVAAPSDADLKRVEALRQEAIAAAKTNDWATCTAKASEAWSLAETPVTAGLLGGCEAELGEYVAAANHLEYALRLDENTDRRKLNSEKLENVKKKVAVLVLTTTPVDAKVTIAGASVADLTKPVYVLPGRISVEGTSPGYDAKSVQVEAAAGETKTVNVSLEKHVDAPPPNSRPIWPAILLGGVSAAGLGIGIALGVVGTGKHDDAMEQAGLLCVGGASASTACGDLNGLISESNTLRNAGWGVGAVGLAAGVGMVTYLLWPQSAPAKATVSADPQHAVLTLQGVF